MLFHCLGRKLETQKKKKKKHNEIRRKIKGRVNAKVVIIHKNAGEVSKIQESFLFLVILASDSESVGQ